MQRYPERVKARLLVSRALKSGKLKRNKCEICGDLKTQAHHENYENPLVVNWFCKSCHDIVHRIKDACKMSYA